VLSPFAGSVENGVYESDFDAMVFATTVKRVPDAQRVEGHLFSRVFRKPETKSNLEVFRSYERELKAGGFTIHLAAGPARDLEVMSNTLKYPASTRPYEPKEGRVGQLDLAQIRSFPEYYLVASRGSGGQTLWALLTFCKQQNLYMVDELTTAAMETGTVTISLDRMRSEIGNAGKIAIYDIHFATGSAEIEPESETALAIIASYLRETQGGFYIVGHTDDTGTLDGNLRLSNDRAAGVKQALVASFGVDAARLEARGVGPLAPVSTNAGEPGRALNRRVEIVQRLNGQ
jgi:outer membrane protein OmpA-like peptidoglycan-associated protein